MSAMGSRLLLAAALFVAAASVHASPITYSAGAGLNGAALQPVEAVDFIALVEGGLARITPQFWPSTTDSKPDGDFAVDGASLVAEPATLILLGSGLLSVAFVRRRLMRRT
jgi:hypothetical protein